MTNQIQASMFTFSLGLLVSIVFPAVGAAQTCDELFKVQPLPWVELNQNNPMLREVGLFPDGNTQWSNLCGPTCMVNAAARILGERGIRLVDPLENLKSVVNSLAEERGLNRWSVINNGMEAYQLADLAKAHFRTLGLTTDVRVVGVEVDAFTDSAAGKLARTSITEADLVPSKNRIVIANYEIWTAQNPDSIEPGDSRTGWTFGHFVIIDQVSRGENGFLQIRTRDPRGFVEAELELRPVRSEGLGINTFELGRKSGETLDRNPHSHTVFTSLIIIDVK